MTMSTEIPPGDYSSFHRNSVVSDTTHHNYANDNRRTNGNGDINGEGANQHSGNHDSSDPSSPTNQQRERRVTAYQRLSHDMSNDHRVLKEITLGKRIGFYRIRGELGSGNFSQVKLGIHALTKEKVAIKILDKTKLDQKTQRLLSREISSMERLHHPNVIRLYEVVETLAKLHIIMEYAGGGELFTKISSEGRLNERDARTYFAQVMAAVNHMHENHIIHRDLKAENVFFATPYLVKVGDFGFSTFSRLDNTLDTFCGSPPYAAPELFRDESYYGGYVDIWALGIMLFFMVTGIMPFRAETVAKLKKCILEGTYNIPSYVSDSCKILIRNILKPVPQDRMSLPEIIGSEWLDGEELPRAFQSFQINPTAGSTASRNTSMSDEERQARDTLSGLGITDEHFKMAHGKDSRSSINGTYRIVLHKIQKKNTKEHEYYLDSEMNGYGGTNGGARYNGRGGNENQYSSNAKKESKMCTIL